MLWLLTLTCTDSGEMKAQRALIYCAAQVQSSKWQWTWHWGVWWCGVGDNGGDRFPDKRSAWTRCQSVESGKQHCTVSTNTQYCVNQHSALCVSVNSVLASLCQLWTVSPVPGVKVGPVQCHQSFHQWYCLSSPLVLTCKLWQSTRGEL